MIIPRLINTPYYSSMENFPTVVGNIDRLVFVVKAPLGYSYRVVDMKGQLNLTDKLIAYICEFDSFNLPHTGVSGPYYVGGLSDTEVKLADWDNTKEFIDVMDYEFLRRKPFCAKIDDDGLTKTIDGRALDREEFNHLFINERYSKDVL